MENCFYDKVTFQGNGEMMNFLINGAEAVGQRFGEKIKLNP